MLNYSDLIIEKEISNDDAGCSHVYSGKYNKTDVAIKVYDKKDPKQLKRRLYGVKNICLMEYKNLFETRKKCPEIAEFLQEPMGISKTPTGLDVLVTKLVLNEDGSISSLLKNSKNSINKDFLDSLEYLFYFLAERKIYHMDFNNGINILVQFNSGIYPVLIDFQRLNDDYYPWLNLTKYLLIDSVEKRYFRRVNRLLNSIK
jgi:hypothetical protein